MEQDSGCVRILLRRPFHSITLVGSSADNAARVKDVYSDRSVATTVLTTSSKERDQTKSSNNNPRLRMTSGRGLAVPFNTPPFSKHKETPNSLVAIQVPPKSPSIG